MDASFRAAQRWLHELDASGAPLSADGGGPGTPLEHLSLTSEPARTLAADVIEAGGGAVRARRVPPATDARASRGADGFAAFLDGTQKSQVVHYHRGIPVVHGTVAAVVRVRLNRRLATWRRGPMVERHVYMPRAYVPDAWWERAESLGFSPRDTSTPDQRSGTPPSRHPLTLLERAVQWVQHDRERVERMLAEEWCRSERSPLFIDGGIAGSERVASAECVVGVVKSHRTMYADGDDLVTVLGLRDAERSSVFKLNASSSWRAPVASWYLRLRDPAGRGPMWGLVRIEAALPDDLARVGARADEISRWVLAESLPLSLPDARWDKMSYGIRDCEEFLRAIC